MQPNFVLRVVIITHLCYNGRMEPKKRKRAGPATRQCGWRVTEPAIEHLKKMQRDTGLLPGQLVSFSIIALSMGLTRSDYVTALLKSGDITLKEAKEGWGL